MCEPAVQGSELGVAEHRPNGSLLGGGSAIAAGVEDEEGSIAIAEVVVVLISERVVIGISVVDFEGVRCAGERGV